MTTTAALSFRRWFEEYTAAFLLKNDDLDYAVTLKQDHTQEVYKTISELAGSFGLSETERATAQACALFHDVGRFPQFARYGTFNDSVSENHALLSLKVLEEEGVLKGVDRETSETIRSAVRCHNCLKLPNHLSEKHRFFACLLRDADKIDIYRVTSRHYSGNGKVGGGTIELGLPDTPGVSSFVASAVANREFVRYETCTSVNDFKLLQLSWVYDINFTESLQLLKKRGYIDVLMDTLQAGRQVEVIKSTIREWIEKKVQGPPADINGSTL